MTKFISLQQLKNQNYFPPLHVNILKQQEKVYKLQNFHLNINESFHTHFKEEKSKITLNQELDSFSASPSALINFGAKKASSPEEDSEGKETELTKEEEDNEAEEYADDLKYDLAFDNEEESEFEEEEEEEEGGDKEATSLTLKEIKAFSDAILGGDIDEEEEEEEEDNSDTDEPMAKVPPPDLFMVPNVDEISKCK